MLILWLLVFLSSGFVIAVVDYWDYEDMMFVYDWNWKTELIRNQELSKYITLH